MKFYQAAEVAEKLKISKQTLVRYEKKGIFPRPKRNRINHWREYTEEDVSKMEQLLGRGFTLVELIMVILIIGILAMVAIPRFQSFYAVKVSGAAKKLVTDMRYVQQLAVAQHENYRINFFKNPANYYEVIRVATGVRAIDPFTRGAFMLDYKIDPQYLGVVINNATFNGYSNLQFNWQGAPQVWTGTQSVNLSAEGRVDLAYQNNTVSIFVQPNTGWIRSQ